MATEADKVNTGALATLVIVSAISLVGITLAVTALARDQMAAETAYKEERAGAQYDKLKSEQLAKLQAGTPIEQAMQKVVADLARDPESATPGTAPAAGASPGGAPSAAPAPEGAPAGSPSQGATGAVLPGKEPDKEAKAAVTAPAGEGAAAQPPRKTPAAAPAAKDAAAGTRPATPPETGLGSSSNP